MAEEENKWKPREDGDEADEDEELEETAFKSAKDAVLFAVEVSPSMLTAPQPIDSKKVDVDSPTSAALKCAYSLMQQRIISNPSDMMGILLYGTEKTRFQGEEQARGGLAYPHCYLLTDLNIPAASDVKALKALVDDDEEFQKLVVPSKDPVSMANVIFCANQIFTTRAPNFASRRLFIVTDNDEPHQKDKALRAAAAVRAKDLYDLGVTIELFPISRPGHEFDWDRFYNDIIYNSSPTDPEAPASTSGPTKSSSTADGVSLLNSLLSSIKSKAAPRRALFANLSLEIGPGFKISVKGYIIFKRQEPRRSCYVWLNGEVAQIAKGVTTQMADDTARTVEKGEIKKAYKFGGEQVAFTPEEVASLRYFGDPGIRIIGFKPLSMLPIWASLRPSTFIYPSEEEFVGSTRVFAALQQKLLDAEKMGLAWFVPRKNATPVIAAIVPGAEKLGEHGEQVIPPGMWIIPLPFADDIRQNPETSLIRAPESLVDLMRIVVQQLQLPKAQYSPEKYPNPSLQWHYRILQAMALDEDIPEKPDDKTVPKHKQIHKRAGAYVVDWGVELEQQYQAWMKEHRGSTTVAKRPAPGDDGAAPKRQRTSNAGTVDDTEMRAHFDKNDISKLTVAVMKGWMDKKNLDTSGKKAELVERIEGFFEEK